MTRDRYPFVHRIGGTGGVSGLSFASLNRRQLIFGYAPFMNIGWGSQYPGSPLIRKAKAYLERHYMNDINLSILTQELHINSVYLGHIFKKETGELFNNYLNRIRIEKAAELPGRHPNLKASEPARQVGYASANYFYTMFKKMMGESPTDYRRETNL